MTFPLESLTLQAFLWAEFGFFGLSTITLRTTPFLKGHLSRSGETVCLLRLGGPEPLLIWFTVALAARVVEKDL